MSEQSLHEQLSRAFDGKELKFFPVAKSRDGKTARVGSYIDARAVMERLDEVMGPEGWSTSYRCIDPADKAVECTLSLSLGGQWVSKSDVGYCNDAKDADNAEKEPWKAAYSDALKRAAVQFGIGRYIYSLKLVKDWLPIDEYGRFTEQPQLMGTTRQGEGNATPTASLASTHDPAAPPPKRKNQYEVLADMGYSRDEVDQKSQAMFGNRIPSQLNADERKRLVIALEDAKKEAARGRRIK